MADDIIIKTNSNQVIAELNAVKTKSQETTAVILANNAQTKASYASLVGTLAVTGQSYAALSTMVTSYTASVTASTIAITGAIAQTTVLLTSLSILNESLLTSIANWNNLSLAISENSAAIGANIVQLILSSVFLLANSLMVMFTKSQYDLLNDTLGDTNSKFETLNKNLIINSVLLLVNSLMAILEKAMFGKLNEALEATNSKYEAINKALTVNSLLMALSAVVSLVYQKVLEKENKSLTSNTTRRTNNNKRTAAGIGLKGFELGSMAGFPVGLALGPAMGALFTGLAFGIVKMGTAALATGGIVSKPTMALVGEGKYPEAVVPLGDSPQFSSMKAGIANAVVQAMAGLGGSSRPIEVVVNLDSREIARATEKGKRLNSMHKTANAGGVL